MVRHDDILDRLDVLTQLGRALSREQDVTRLLESILLAAKRFAHADGGTLYSVHGDEVRFEALRNDSLGLAMGGTTGTAITLPAVALHLDDGTPNHRNVVSHAVLDNETVNIPDAYHAAGFDFAGTRAFDARTGYRSQSFLTVPLQNHDHEVIGVLQLINARAESGDVVAFTAEDERLVEALASQAAIVLTNRQLMTQLEVLFESLINLINTAIDDKSPYTGAHCQRVPLLTMMLAEAVHQADYGPLAGFHLDDRDRYELKIAGMLHDCGKITTPVHIVDKATKLQTLYDRIEVVDARFEILLRDAEIARLRGEISEAEHASRIAQLQSDRALLHESNIGGEFLSDEKAARIVEIGRRTWTTHDGEARPFLSEEEMENLSVRRGTLTASERKIINRHLEMTHRLLEGLPWPRHLRNVVEFVSGHHERMDGKGYPRGLTRDQLSVQARMIGIADVFEALTAKDRPYKSGKTLSEALTIMGRMKLEGHIDPDLYDVFVKEGVYLEYAKRFLPPEQIDEVDVAALPGTPVIAGRVAVESDI